MQKINDDLHHFKDGSKLDNTTDEKSYEMLVK